MCMYVYMFVPGEVIDTVQELQNLDVSQVSMGYMEEWMANKIT